MASTKDFIRVAVGAGGVAVAAAGWPAVIVAAGATAAVGLAGYGYYKIAIEESRVANRRRRLKAKGSGQ